jgi:hypothetical protein
VGSGSAIVATFGLLMVILGGGLAATLAKFLHPALPAEDIVVLHLEQERS